MFESVAKAHAAREDSPSALENLGLLREDGRVIRQVDALQASARLPIHAAREWGEALSGKVRDRCVFVDPP